MLKIFESFAGVGSQHSAMQNVIKRNNDFKFELAGISEWDMYATIAYFKMNGYEFHDEFTKHLSDEEIREYFKTRPYSLDSKELSKTIYRQPIRRLRQLYEVEKTLNNIPDINTLKGKHLVKNKVDIFTYSFPCQDLSNAGKGAGMSKDSNTRSGLLWQVERVLDEINEKNSDDLPKYLLMENVTSIVSANHKQDYEEWKDKLNKLGYKSYDGILDARDFGVAQQRKRFFCISILDSKHKVEYESEDINIILKDKKKKTRNLDEFLRIDYSVQKYIEEALEATPNHTKSRVQMMEGPKKERELVEYKSGKYKVCATHTRTLTTKQDRWNNAGMISFEEKTFNDKENAVDVRDNKTGRSQMRFLTPREAYLLMGFKEIQIGRVIEEKLGKDRMYRQSGNSIVVDVLEAIFEKFIIEEERGCNE